MIDTLWLLLLATFFVIVARSSSELLSQDSEDYNWSTRREDVASTKEPSIAEVESESDSVPVVAAFRKGENSLAGILDANRLTGIEPYQGDIDLDGVDEKLINSTKDGNETSSGARRNVLTEKRKLWPGAVVPYIIDFSRVGSTSAIRAAMDEIQQVSCVRFRLKRSGDKHWLRIFRGIGCHSGIGRKFWATKATDMSLGRMCIQRSVITHELLHSLGFFHEQSRPDRDTYVKILYENIRPALKENFDKFDAYEADIQDTDYDYQSLMHYTSTAFTVNGKDTIRPIFNETQQLGSKQMTPTDIVELNKLYQCKSKSKVWGEWGGWSPCRVMNRKCRRQRQRYCLSEDQALCTGADEYRVEDQDEDCTDPLCRAAIHGHWGMWSSWSTCSLSCNEGRFTRERACDNPAPQHGGKVCKGSMKQTAICFLNRCNAKWYDTNFEDGWGMWQQDEKDDFDWIRSSTGSATLRTGPKRDHSSGRGFMALIDGTPPRRTGQVARLQSKELPSEFGPKCMTFFYAMSGKNIGYLTIFIETVGGRYLNMWRKNGHQGDTWYNAVLQIPKLSDRFRIVLEAQRGNGELSDIAVDDVYFDEGQCSVGVQGCENHNPSCEDWAYMGECRTNANWMKKYCCKACEAVGSCYDRNRRACWYWARRGECKRNESWMLKNCCHSCRRCRDRDPQCSKWKSEGECNKNKLWMYRNCRTSCGYCK